MNNPRLLEAYNSLDVKEPFRLAISNEFFLRRILAEATETESVEFLAFIQKMNVIRVTATQQDWDVFTQLAMEMQTNCYNNMQHFGLKSKSWFQKSLVCFLKKCVIFVL